MGRGLHPYHPTSTKLTGSNTRYGSGRPSTRGESTPQTKVKNTTGNATQRTNSRNNHVHTRTQAYPEREHRQKPPIGGNLVRISSVAHANKTNQESSIEHRIHEVYKVSHMVGSPLETTPGSLVPGSQGRVNGQSISRHNRNTHHYKKI